MKSALCERFGIDFPLFAFTHCRDVVAAVTNAGGFGVLGAVAHTPETLEIELKWIDEQVQGKPYGVDLLIPNKLEGKNGSLSAAEYEAPMSPENRQYVAELLGRRCQTIGDVLCGLGRWVVEYGAIRAFHRPRL